MLPFSRVYGLGSESGCLACCDRSQAPGHTRLSSSPYPVNVMALHAVSRCCLIIDFGPRFKVTLWRFTLTRRRPSIVSFGSATVRAILSPTEDRLCEPS